MTPPFVRRYMLIEEFSHVINGYLIDSLFPSNRERLFLLCGLGGPYEVKCILQAYFDLERGTVPTTMRNGARMWDCAGVSVPFAYICCG